MTIPCPKCGGEADLEIGGTIQNPENISWDVPVRGNKRGVIMKSGGETYTGDFFLCRSCEWGKEIKPKRKKRAELSTVDVGSDSNRTG